MEQPKTAEPLKTWYELHKEQVKLIQFLLYHLRKYEDKKEPQPKQSVLERKEGDFILKFE